MKSQYDLEMEEYDKHITWMSKTGGFARDKTLRDEFAMQAMPSDLANGFHESDFPHCARRAYKLADAMLKAREGK